MRFFVVHREEFSGYECDGHMQTYIVAANTKEEAFALLDDRSDYEKERNWFPHTKLDDVVEFELPSLRRKKKPFIVI